jgi:integrase
VGHIQKRAYRSARTGREKTSWQARYTAPDGRERTKRFERKVDAENWIRTNEGDVVRGAWVDPKAGTMSLRSYANHWLELRYDLRPTTRSKYRRLLDVQILPALGDVQMNRISPARVRSWHAELLRLHRATAAGAYRLLATMFNTAIEDEIVLRSPCRVKGAADEGSAERPTASLAEVDAAVDACPARLRLAILLAVWCQLRRGEILGLQRRDVDEFDGTLKVARSWVQVSDGAAAISPPKTEAGKRTVNVPPNVIPVLVQHLNQITDSSREAWLFPGENGNPVSSRTLDRAWDVARIVIGRPELHLHDLRHTGLTWAASLGATTSELMHRAGHKSPVAALRYQHATLDRDAMIADALGALAQGEVVPLRRTKDGRSSGAPPAATRSDAAEQVQQVTLTRNSGPRL